MTRRTSSREKDDLLSDVGQFHREIERFFYGLFQSHPAYPVLSEGKWRPPADVYEREGQWVIKVELPGLRQKDITVALEGHTLRVRGVRRHLQESCVTYHQMEINYGDFERSFALPHAVPEGSVSAEYRDGFLYIAIPRVGV